MADIRPFRACHYTTTDTATLARLLTPPYDIISPDEQRALHDAHPNNFIRLELGYTRDTDTDADNRYTRAAAEMRRWFDDRVLVEDATPAFYLYDQVFMDPTGARRKRRSLVAAVRLVPFEDRVVLPHECTLSAPKEDRFRLMSALDAQTSPVFGLYDDPSGVVMAALDFAKTPVASTTTPDGIMHSLARVTSRETIRAVAGLFVKRQILIADGHHRYETALRYTASVAGRAAASADAASNFTLFALTPLSDPGLVILPTHRLVRGIPADRSSANALTRQLTAFGFQTTALDSIAACDAALAKTTNAVVAFAVVADRGRSAILATRQAATGDARDEKSLDVVALHEEFFGKGLGFSAESQARQDNLSYVKSTADAIAAVESGRADFAVIMRATSLQDLFRVTSRGIRLPQKSTYFIPKLVSGLFFRRIEPLETVEVP